MQISKGNNSRFEPPFGGLRRNARGSSMALWKANCRLPISDNQTVFASSHGCRGSLIAQILGEREVAHKLSKLSTRYVPLHRGMM